MQRAEVSFSSKWILDWCLRLFAVVFFAILWGEVAAEEQGVSWEKPFLLIEAWHDREYVSDIYVCDLEGNILKRLTEEPLPSCSLAAVSPDGKQIALLANASTFYHLSLSHFSLSAIHAGPAQGVSFSPDGKTVAYVARGFEKGSGGFLFQKPVIAGASLKRAKVPLRGESWETAFSQEGTSILLTAKAEISTRIMRCKAAEQLLQPWIEEEGMNFSNITFSPGGGRVAMIREDPEKRVWSIASADWPGGNLKILRNAPEGIRMSDLIYTANEKYLLFRQGGVLARMPVDGGLAEGITGELDHRPLKSPSCGPRVKRPSWMPSIVEDRVAIVEYEEGLSSVRLIDVNSKESVAIPLPMKQVKKAVLVE